MKVTKEQSDAIREWQGMRPEQQRYAIYRLYNQFPTTKKMLLTFLPKRKQGDPVVHETVPLNNPEGITTCGLKNAKLTVSWEPQKVSCEKCFLKMLERT